MKHRVRAVKLVLTPVVVEATECLLLRSGDCRGAVSVAALCTEEGRLHDHAYATQGQAGVAQNAATRGGSLALGKAAQVVMALVYHHGQSPDQRLLAVAQAEHHQRRGHAATFAARVADAPGHAGHELDERLGVYLEHVQHGLHDRRCTVTHAQQVGQATVAEPASRLGIAIERWSWSSFRL